MEKSINIEELSEEQINYLTNTFIAIFTRVRDVLIERKNWYVNEYGEKFNISNLSMSPMAKLMLIVKKIAKNSIISGLTGVSPMFLDNDLSELKNNNINNFMQCDIAQLAISVLNDAIKGTEELINRLNSSDKRDEMLKSIYSFYEENKDMQYNSGKKSDYTAFLTYLLFVHSDIYDDTKGDKFAALTRRGYDVGMKYDFFVDIKEAYSKLDVKTNSMGR